MALSPRNFVTIGDDSGAVPTPTEHPFALASDSLRLGGTPSGGPACRGAEGAATERIFRVRLDGQYVFNRSPSEQSGGRKIRRVSAGMRRERRHCDRCSGSPCCGT